MDWTGVDWTGLEWSGLDWTGLEWTGLDLSGVEWTGLDWTGVYAIRGYGTLVMCFRSHPCMRVKLITSERQQAFVMCFLVTPMQN